MDRAMDRKKAEAAFLAYTAGYDSSNPMIDHKIKHTLRVASLCDRIAAGLWLDRNDTDYAWFLGLLHDIGRFEQVRRYGTFIDSVSVDHAQFGADLLFREGLIRTFPIDSLAEEDLAMAETCIRLHNTLSLPDDLTERTKLFCNILRDADKIDIFRVIDELPFEERIGSSRNLFLAEAEKAGGEVMRCILEHRCVPRQLRRTRFEGFLSHGCLAFELTFDESRRIARSQGYLAHYLAETDADGNPLWNEEEMKQLRILKEEIGKVWGGLSCPG